VRTKQQEVSSFVIDYLKENNLLESNKAGELNDFAGYSRSVPSMIITNGFLHTILFICSKKGKFKKYEHVFELMKRWLAKKGFVRSRSDGEAIEDKEFMEQIAKMDGRDYMACQEEVLRFMEIAKVVLKAYSYDVKTGAGS